MSIQYTTKAFTKYFVKPKFDIDSENDLIQKLEN